MKNIEKFEKEITERVNNERSLECSLAIIAGFKEGEGECDKNCEECHKRLVKWMYSEYKEPILTEEEKNKIKSIVNMLSHFECVPFNVELDKNVYGDYIRFWYKNAHGSVNALNTPNFDHTKMFKGMKVGEKYKLEELGI